MTFLDRLESVPPNDAVALLSDRFVQNKNFFSERLPNLAVFLNRKTKDYELSISASGINIQNVHNKEYIYPVREGKSLIFDASKDISSNPSTSPIWHRHINNNVIGEESTERVPVTGDIVNKIVRRVSKDPDFKKKKIHFSGKKQLPATVFLGISAGLHIEYILEKYETLHSVLIYEPNVDLFILSCYFIDYAKLYEKTSEFSCYIVVSGFIPVNAVKDFFASRLITNSFIRFEYYGYRDRYIEDAIKVVSEASRTSSRGWGTYEDESIGLNNKLEWINPEKPQYPFLQGVKKIGAPICVVGNGPSLNFLIGFLKENQSKMIILSAGTALAPLKRNGIEPDFHIEIERMDHVKEWLNDAGLGDTPLVAADIAHETTLDTSKETYMFVRTASAAEDLYKPKFVLDYANPLVGNAAFALALNFSNEIYLCGLDMGFKKDAKIHAEGSKYDELEDRSAESLPTRGNFSKDIYTNSLFSLSRVAMEEAIRHNLGVQVYNLSDGVYIDGTKPLQHQKAELGIIYKEKTATEIKSSFSKEDFFGSLENNYQEELKQFKRDILTILHMPKVTDKTLLFKTIDYCFYATTIQRKNNKVTGTLLSGSLWHILNSLFVMLSHVDRDDVDTLYKEIVTIIENEFKRFSIG